ncbi:MAG: hypothetical protein EBT02_01500 [Planctomycetia bacterium]|nr:hypothetical protein [Planctomycetia bacterium]
MNTNKPYAWINVNDEYKILFDDELPNAYPSAWIPLYTHPAKELTDDEILDTFDPHFDADIGDKELIKFSRAILRKTQEK